MNEHYFLISDPVKIAYIIRINILIYEQIKPIILINFTPLRSEFYPHCKSIRNTKNNIYLTRTRRFFTIYILEMMPPRRSSNVQLR